MKSRFLKVTSFALLIALLSAASTPGRSQAGADALKEANDLFQAQDWAKAAKAYESITKEQPSNGIAWYRLGYALHAMGKYDGAVEAYQKVIAIRSNPLAIYNLACAYSRLNEKDKAFEWLNKLLQTGFKASQPLKTDEDFANLRSDPRFKELVATAEKKDRPCAFSPQSRQFDFWVGEWNVENPQGQRVGTNSVQLILGDCVVFENWTGGSGGSGKSFNFYNAATGKWQQTWVDDVGSVLEFTGEFKDGAIRYTAETPLQGGGKTLHRLTFFPISKDHVRQLWEQSTDGGKTWAVAFDGQYKRKI
ncbi:MAG: tetratricopeptide repeat protein [Blastocatellia bacterium]|nr:tetratricopeptide repeat protein [Blastocatellia bacterium]